MERMNLFFFTFVPYTKINSKEIIDINIAAQINQEKEEHVCKKICI